MKKVLHVAKYYYPFRGGTEQITQDCANSLKGQYEQKVLCFNDTKTPKRDFIDEIEIIRVGCLARIASQPVPVDYSRTLKTLFNNFCPDVVIFHYPNPLVARYLLKYIPDTAKLIVYWHTDIVKQKILKQFFAGQNRRLVRRADVLIATSPPYLDGSVYLASAREKCRIIPNCINEKRLQVDNAAEQAAKRIREAYSGKVICFSVGRHTEYKGFKYLIQASRYLDDRFEIFLCGEGEETKRLKREARTDKKIHFLGKLDDTELKGYLLAMDVLCFPSVTRNEAFGLALAEGMYYGKPAVTFTIPGSGVNYVCRDKEDGLEVPNRDVKAYAEALKRLAFDPALRRKMGIAGKKRVEENFLSTKFKDHILALVGSL